MKLTGVNTAGYSYSARDQVIVNIGTPNLKLTKSVVGPNKTAIQASEVYTYTVKIENTNTLGTETDAFSFTLTDALSSWFSLNTNSISVTGTGTYSSYNYTTSNINVLITNLQPGSYLTLTYSVTLNDNIAPGLTITTTATNTNPYSQPYNASLSNYQYSGLIKTASATISSKPVTIVKTNNTDIFKVGSTILYIITVKVPLGTILYNLSTTDTLPTGQSYLDPADRNGILVTPQLSSNTINFPVENIIDARTASQTIVYTFFCKINDAVKVPPNYSTDQINKCSCSYKQGSSTGTTKTVSSSLTVVVNHPNLTLTLLGTDVTTSISSNSSLSIKDNSKVLFNLSIYNNSMIDLVNGKIEIPIDSQFNFYSIDSTSMCTAYYDIDLSKIIVTIPTLQAKQYGNLNFTLQAKPALPSGSSMITTALCDYYYNNITTSKVYGGETSNTVTCTLQVSLSLLPDPQKKINDTTSFTVTQPGNIAIIDNYFTNTGGGIDSFNISIPSALIDYTLYIDGIKIADIPKLTDYSATVDLMRNLPPGTTKTITIETYIHKDSPLGTRYDFNVTVTSITSPYPNKTVYNIDPN